MARRARRMLGTERPLILMYHRIADLDHDPWALAVSPSHFAGHLDVLRARRDVVPLSWLAGRIEQDRPAPHAVAITFDDGYVDLLDNARPLLERHTCPATVFLPPGFVGAAGGFWWDALTRIFLATPDLPGRLMLGSDAWEVRSDNRRALHDEVWALLKPMNQGERAAELTALLAWAKLSGEAPMADRCMTETQLHSFAQPGFVDLGAHTMTHPSLPLLPPSEQTEEISHSWQWIFDVLGLEPRGLAFPFGDHDQQTLAAARSSGVGFACTTVPDAVRRGADLFALPRLAVGNLDAADFEKLIARYG